MRRAHLTAIPTPGGCWPTHEQVLLLRAALLEPAEAAAAWAEWRAVASPEDADQGSSRLFPLAHGNLPADVVAPEDRAIIRGAYRAAWYRNMVLCRRAADVLAALHRAGIE